MESVMEGSGGKKYYENEIRAINETRKYILDRMNALEEKLIGLDNANVPDSQPFITFRVVKHAKDLAGNPNLRAALKEDLKTLREEMEKLKELARTVRKEKWAAETAAMEKAAASANTNMRKRMHDMLKKAQDKGYLTEEEISTVRGEGEVVIKNWIDVVKRRPSRQNMKNLLQSLEVPCTFGTSEDGGSFDEGVKTLQDAAVTRLQTSIQQYKVNPSKDNTTRMFKEAERSMRMGGDPEKTMAAFDTYVETRKRQMNNAERIFRSNPTIENYTVMEKAELSYLSTGYSGGISQSPPPLRRRKPPEDYPVKHGDTWAKISKDYYGHPGYWDVVFRYNLDVCSNPRALHPGMVLTIP
jgi:nucleoid-associated protein YgaU